MTALHRSFLKTVFIATHVPDLVSVDWLCQQFILLLLFIQQNIIFSVFCISGLNSALLASKPK